MTQCQSCGGFCGRVCQRDNTKAIELACYYQNRCCDLEEIIELFCMDAADVNKDGTPPATRVLITPYRELDGAIT